MGTVIPTIEPVEFVDPYARIVSIAPFGIYIVDADFCLAQVSKGCRKVFEGIDPLVGRDFAEILRILWEEPFASECIARFRRTLETGEPYRAADTGKPRSNVEEDESYDWKIERITLPDGNYGVVCYFYDLTERIQMAEALRESEASLRVAHDELELRVAERTSELNDAHRELTTTLRDIVAVQEAERQRISRDVHDHLGGTLTGLRLKLENLQNLAAKHPHLLKHVERLAEITKQLDSDISYLAWELRPTILDDLGLVPALKCFADEWSERFGVQAAFQAVGVSDDVELGRDLETNLYRITQEALTNIAKHAEATSVDIVLGRSERALTLVIEDNGKGLGDVLNSAVDCGGAKHGLGLGGMKDRARLIGASLEIETSDSGTAVFLSIPQEHLN